MKSTKDPIALFGLTSAQTNILFELQRLLITEDLKVSKGKKNEDRKIDWERQWFKSINDYLKGIGSLPLCVHNDPFKIKEKVKSLEDETESKIWKYLVLLECVLYHPYYPLSKEKSDVSNVKGLKLDKSSREKALNVIAEILEINADYIEKFDKAYKKSYKSLSGFWTKLFIGAGVGVVVLLVAILTFQPEIAAIFAAEGLTGAAATASGLAALGGGAIAAGGAGTAGGFAVLVGGGTLIGTGVGVTGGFVWAQLGSGAVLSEAAKMQVVLKEIVLAIQKDTKSFQEVLSRIIDQQSNMKRELIALRANDASNKQKIKDLEKSIEYLEKLISNSNG